MIQKTKDDKLDFIKIKNFRFLKGTPYREKIQNTSWEKIIPNQISDKGLFP